MKTILAAMLVLFGTSAFQFEDGFEAHALEPSDIKAISIDAAAPVPVQNVKVDAAGLLTAVKVGPPVPPPVTSCPTVPAGYTELLTTWATAFYGKPYSQRPTFLAPVGAYTFRTSQTSTRGPAMGSRYLVIPFVAGVDEGVTLRLYGAQPITDAGRDSTFRNGYNPARPASSVFLSVSPCKGDIRPQNRLSPDPWLAKCRTPAGLTEGTFGWSSRKPAPAAACPLEPGQTYYLHVMFSDPAKAPGVATCKSAADNGRCEINIGG